MSLKLRINNAISALLPNSAIFAEYHKRSGGNKAEWKRQANIINAKEIKDWTRGVMSATDPDNPRRGDLMRFYQMLMLDNHLASVIDTRILRVQRSSFKMTNKNDEENYELKELLERPWFEDIIRLVLSSRFQGATLIEMFDVDAETQELSNVQEIPQSNFIAQKGIIIKEEYDDKGIDFRTGAYSDYYLQVGGDWDLGMLNQLAMIVLAKKLGIGSWMSYVDKFGVPPIFAITDRMDTGRRDELFEMLSNFRQNMFAVLQGNEKIEVPRITETNQHQVFLQLIDGVCNKEISKRVLGGTASTDEQAYVGSAEVQERVAQDRYEADKLLFKYIFNTKIRPRLVKLSGIYADFANYTFEWDNQETLNINSYIDAVQKLSPAYEFDIDEIKARTGLPIIGTRALASSPALYTGEGAEPSKKKVDAVIISQPSATAPPLPVERGLGGEVIAVTWDAAVEQLVNQIWAGGTNGADLNRDLVLKYYSGLNKATKNGWGAGYYTNDLTRDFRENLLKFSGAKSYSLITKIQELKFDGIDKQDFTEQAKKLINLHNETWQWTEEKFAANSASSARDFQAYRQDADLYPNLKYRTMGDAEVRPEHAANEGVIKPINQWTKIPPLDYGCRCWLEQTFENPNNRDISVYNDTIANNPAVAGELFTKNNGYFQRITKEDKQAVYANTEKMKEFMPYSRVIEVPNGKKVLVNDFADPNESDDNIATAKILAENHNMDIKIPPHTDGRILVGKKNPEFYFNGKIADAKRIKSYDGISDGFKSAKEQGCNYVIIDFNKHFNANKSLNLQKVANKIRNRRLDFENNELDGCYVVFGKNSVYVGKNIFSKTLSNEDLSNKIKEALKELKAD